MSMLANNSNTITTRAHRGENEKGIESVQQNCFMLKGEPIVVGLENVTIDNKMLHSRHD